MLRLAQVNTLKTSAHQVEMKRANIYKLKQLYQNEKMNRDHLMLARENHI